MADKAPGDAHDTPATRPPRPRVLRFEVSPETFATVREAMLTLRRQAGSPLNDDALLLDGRASYPLSLHVCAACGAGAQSAAGDLVPVDAAVVDMAQCDAQHLGELLPSAVQPPAARPPAPAPRAANENTGMHSATHDRSSRAHVGAVSRPPPTRAKQTIPPALRRAVLARDRHRCTVPGCTHATFVDVHHIRPRSVGGRHEASNLSPLCSAHHRAAHRGELRIERDPDGTLRFRHADGASYGEPVAPRRIDAHAKVFSALRNLGFPESAARTVLRELRADANLAASSVEHLLREALCRIRPTAR